MRNSYYFVTFHETHNFIQIMLASSATLKGNSESEQIQIIKIEGRSKSVLYTNRFFCFDIQNNLCTQQVLILYCGLDDARITVSDKNLPVSDLF